MNGIAYDITRSGSGTVAGVESSDLTTATADFDWHLRCDENTIDDTRICVAERRGVGISIDERGDLRLHVGTNHSPGSEIAIRIDRGVPVRADERIGFSLKQHSL